MSNNDQNIRILEALLFASAEPVSTKDLHDRMPEGADVGGALMELKALYAERGVNLVDLDGHWAFRTATDLAGLLQIEREAQKKLSRAAMETLAIIAYHQPLTRPEIENIRGVATHKGTLDALMEMNWIKPGRRREAPGRPLTWVTTTEFLDHFSIQALSDLPGLEDLKASGLLDRRPAIEAIPASRDLFEEDSPENESDDDDLESEFEDDNEDDNEDDDAEFESEIEEEAAA